MRIAVLAADGVERVELLQPWAALADAGHELLLASPSRRVRAMDGMEPSDLFEADVLLDDLGPGDAEALLLPGGAINADTLRMSGHAVDLTRAHYRAGNVIAAICHAPWLLVEADVVLGRTLTSYPSLRTDITNAGGRWIDSEVYTEDGIITSRRPADLPAFSAKILEELREAHEPRMLPVVTPAGRAVD